MARTSKAKPRQTLLELKESLNELIRYTYLSGLQDGKEMWNENEEVVNRIGNERVSKIISVLNPYETGN